MTPPRLHFYSSTLYHTTCITTIGDQTVTLLDCYCSHTYQLQEHLNHTFILLIPHCTFYIICISTTEHFNQTLTLPYVYQLQEHCNQTYTLLNYTLTKLWLWHILCTPTTATTWPNFDCHILCTPTTATTWPNFDCHILCTSTTATTLPNFDSAIVCVHQIQQQKLDPAP